MKQVRTADILKNLLAKFGDVAVYYGCKRETSPHGKLKTNYFEDEMKLWERIFRSKVEPAVEVLENPNPESPYVVCETFSAITTHLREFSLSPLKLGGGLKVNTLCGMQAAWDTRIPVACARCRDCRRKAEDLAKAVK